MAEPIPLRRIQPDPSRDIRARLETAPIEHSEAVLATYELLQVLHDHGVLDFLRGLSGASGDIATRLASGTNTPEAIAAIRNTISLMRILASVDPGILHGVANIVTKAPDGEPRSPGLLGILTRLGSKESRRAIGAAAYGLQVFGRVLISRQLEKK